MQLSPTSPAVATSHSSRPQGLSLGRSLVLFVMLVLPVLVVAITMEDGHWVDGLPSLRTLAVAGLALGFFMGQGRLGIRKGVVVGLVSGIGIGSGLGFLAVDAQVTLSGIAVVLLGVAWLTGYTTGWLAHRGGFGLLAAIPGAAVMLILLGLLLLYALAATPAVACLHTWGQPSPGRLAHHLGGWPGIGGRGAPGSQVDPITGEASAIRDLARLPGPILLILGNDVQAVVCCAGQDRIRRAHARGPAVHQPNQPQRGRSADDKVALRLEAEDPGVRDLHGRRLDFAARCS